MSKATHGQATTVICLVARQNSVNHVINSPPGGSATDIVTTIVDDLFDSDAQEKIGHDEIVCVAVSATDLQCIGTIFLPKGKLTFTMPYSL